MDTFWEYVKKTDDCWLWTGSTHRGYGKYRTKIAHRYVLEMEGIEVPKGMDVDHLCRVASCVRPDHLEIVTPAENRRRQAASLRAEKTHCPSGHEFTPDNIYLAPRTGARGCVECRRIRSRDYQRRKRQSV